MDSYNITIDKPRHINYEDEDLSYFFEHAFHDMRFFLKATTNGSSSIYTFFGDTQKSLYYISDNLKETFGFKRNLVEGLPYEWQKRIYGDKWKDLFKRNFEYSIENKLDYHDMRYQVKDVNGEVFWIHSTCNVLWDDKNEKPLFLAGRLIKQSDEFAVDPMTKVALVSALKYRLTVLKRYNYSCKVVGLTLNHINQINLQYGRSVGDTIIKRIIKKMTNSLIGKVTGYSVSGVKYIAIIDNEYRDEIDIIIQEVTAIVNEVYYSMGIKVDRTCSFAIAEYDCQKDDPGNFIENVISLMKLSGNDIYGNCVDNSKMYIDQIHENAKMSLMLSRDVFNLMNNFKLNIQPIVSPYENRIVGGECLLSWEYEGKRVSPEIFIPIIEKDRLISIAGKWIIKNGIKYCKEILKHYPDFYLTVNISRKQLQDEDLFDFIPKILKKEKFDGRHLVFEITESTVDKDPKRTHRLVEVCRLNNIGLAIDDFGTGYSSFRALMRYDYDILKIDRTLLLELEKSVKNLDYIKGLASACHKNKIKICVEGVETENQKAIAEAIPCDVIQGFYYYRSMPVDEILGQLNKQ